MFFRKSRLLFFFAFIFAIHGMGLAKQELTIIYEGNAQFEIILQKGQRILIDVYDPDRLSRPANRSDILLSTHHHWDHYRKEYAQSFPGMCRDRPGQWVKQDLTIRAIPASHAADFVEPLHPDDEMLIFSICYQKFHLVHMGDTAQLRLVKDQMKWLQDVDVMMVNLRYDPRGYLDPVGFGPIEQIKPGLVIPSHLDRVSGEYAAKTRQGFQRSNNSVTLRKGSLQKPDLLLFLGENAREFPFLPKWE